MIKRILFFALILPFMSTVKTAAQAPKLLTPELLWEIGRVNLECVSPDAKTVIYSVQRYNIEANNSKRQLFACDITSGATRALTQADQNASDAQFHPAGDRLALIYNGALCEMPLAGGVPVPVTGVDMEIGGYQYAPDGKSLLFISEVQHDPSAAERYKLSKTKGEVFDGLFYRHWKSWRDGKYSNIFVAPYANGALSAAAKNIMNERYDSPLKPDGGMEQITWSPDARFIVYTSRKLWGTDEAVSTNSDIWVYEVSSGKTMNFSKDLPGYDLDPVFSPDGRYLIWTSMERAGYEADRTRIMLLDTYTQERRELTKGWDYEARSPQWSEDGQSIYFTSAQDFTYQLFEYSLATEKIRKITEGRHDYTAFKVAGDQLVAQRNAMDAPAEIYVINPQNGKTRQLTNVTDKPWKGLEKGKVERHTVKTADGKDMNVWMVLPPNFDPKKKYPALVYCQGGPQSAVSQFFSYRWNFQLMAAKGYIVVAPCRRGMPGSGQAWNDEIREDWGGKPMQDILSATDYAAALPYVDKARMGAVGASFGGYSVYWLAGNHQKRFKTFISHCGLFNLESFYGSTEEMWFANNDFGGAYWNSPKPQMYETASPHKYVQNWDTPMLVIHNELDFRVPIGEGIQAFQAAQLRGIPSKFLYFPDEGHHVVKAQNSLLWQRVFFEWLDTYLMAP
ncbi:MAG: S9 family peptidase [Chitinophagales bacterium]|nr:S9 family peptidase [Chitinophagales bacterium]